MKKSLLFLVLCLVGVLCAVSAQAQTKERVEMLGTFGDWSAYKTKEGKGNLCYMVSVPQKSEGKYKRRGDVFLMVTHRPNDKSFNVVSLTAGYPYKVNSSVSFVVDKKAEVSLFTNEDTAWAKNAKDDNKLVNLFKSGTDLVVKGKSKLGNQTTDRFSLKGFTKAYRSISAACGKK